MKLEDTVKAAALAAEYKELLDLKKHSSHYNHRRDGKYHLVARSEWIRDMQGNREGTVSIEQKFFDIALDSQIKFVGDQLEAMGVVIKEVK